jgi:acylphosphatase
MITRCFIIHGQVQGVFYRDSTRKEALKRGITGSAENLKDGTVKVIVQGLQAPIDELKLWLLEGPEMSEVIKVDEVDIEDDLEFNNFSVR